MNKQELIKENQTLKLEIITLNTKLAYRRTAPIISPPEPTSEKDAKTIRDLNDRIKQECDSGFKIYKRCEVYRNALAEALREIES